MKLSRITGSSPSKVSSQSSTRGLSERPRQICARFCVPLEKLVIRSFIGSANRSQSALSLLSLYSG